MKNEGEETMIALCDSCCSFKRSGRVEAIFFLLFIYMNIEYRNGVKIHNKLQTTTVN